MPPLAEQAHAPRAKQVVLLTDGAVRNTRELVDAAAAFHTELGVRVFTIGIGEGASPDLVMGVANASHGAAEMVRDGLRLEPVVARAMERVLAPGIVGVNVNWGTLAPFVKQTAGSTKAVFAGNRMQLFAILGASDTPGEHMPRTSTIRISCQGPDGPLEWTVEASLVGETSRLVSADPGSGAGSTDATAVSRSTESLQLSLGNATADTESILQRAADAGAAGGDDLDDFLGDKEKSPDVEREIGVEPEAQIPAVSLIDSGALHGDEDDVSGWVPPEADGGDESPPGPGTVVAAAAFAVCKELLARAIEANDNGASLRATALRLALSAGIVTA